MDRRWKRWGALLALALLFGLGATAVICSVPPPPMNGVGPAPRLPELVWVRYHTSVNVGLELADHRAHAAPRIDGAMAGTEVSRGLRVARPGRPLFVTFPVSSPLVSDISATYENAKRGFTAQYAPTGRTLEAADLVWYEYRQDGEARAQ